MFLATNSPLILYGRLATTRSAMSFVHDEIQHLRAGVHLCRAEGGVIFDAGGATSPADEEEEDGGRDVGDFGEGRVGKAIERSRSFNSF